MLLTSLHLTATHTRLNNVNKNIYITTFGAQNELQT